MRWRYKKGRALGVAPVAIGSGVLLMLIPIVFLLSGTPMDPKTKALFAGFFLAGGLLEYVIVPVCFFDDVQLSGDAVVLRKSTFFRMTEWTVPFSQIASYDLGHWRGRYNLPMNPYFISYEVEENQVVLRLKSGGTVSSAVAFDKHEPSYAAVRRRLRTKPRKKEKKLRDTVGLLRPFVTWSGTAVRLLSGLLLLIGTLYIAR